MHQVTKFLLHSNDFNSSMPRIPIMACQLINAIIWTNTVLLLIGPRINFSKMCIS